MERLVSALSVFLFVLFLARATRGQAAVPVLEGLFPVALERGQTHQVTAVGKFDPWPPKVWTETPGVQIEPSTNVGMLKVIITSNTPSGPYFIRLFNDEGASNPRFLMVTPDPQGGEEEPNNHFLKPQKISKLPAAINGRLEKQGDVDSFAVTLVSGQTLVASLEAYTLMSPVDAVLQIVDDRGKQMAFNHDNGRTFDPFLSWTCQVAGTYVVQVFGFAYPADSDIRFTGNPRCIYRLHLTSGPAISYTLPLGIRRGSSTSLRLVGWNLGALNDQPVIFDGSTLGPRGDRVLFQPSGFALPLEVEIGEGPEVLETEPNGPKDPANPIEIPGAISGSIGFSGDEDRFAFSARKGDRWALDLKAASLGFLVDAWLEIHDAAGKMLVRNEGGNGSDPRLDWTVPSDGTYLASVGNLLHRGGDSLRYRLQIIHPVPSVKVTVSENSFTLAPGATNDIKVSLKRLFGSEAVLTLSITNLPTGVSAQPVTLSAKDLEGVLKLIATPDAKPFTGTFRIQAEAKEGGRVQLAMMELISSGENNGVPQGFKRLLIESVDAFWLTLTAPPKAKK